MKSELLESLRCLSCLQGGFALTTEHRTDEIDRGFLTCMTCGRTYPIEDGVLMMLDQLTPTMANEVSGWEKFSAREGWLDPPDDYLLWLPKPRAQIPTDTLNWHWHADNFQRGAATTQYAGKFVLDLAAGRCWTTKELARRGARAVATDILVTDKIGLKTGRRYIQHSGDYFERVACSMTALPFVDDTFDVVFAYASMHHSENLAGAMIESARVLKSGGEFILAGEPVGRFYETLAGPLRRHADDLHERSPRLAEWRRALRSAGFAPPEIVRDAVFDVHSVNPIMQMLRPLASMWPSVYTLKLTVLGGILILKSVKPQRSGGDDIVEQPRC